MVMPSDLIMRLNDQYNICLVNTVSETVLIPNTVSVNDTGTDTDCNQITASSEVGNSEIEDDNHGKDDSEIYC